MGFCPYFLHEKSSGGISDNLKLTAGTLTTRFTRDFLFVIICKKHDQSRANIFLINFFFKFSVVLGEKEKQTEINLINKA